MGTNGVRCDWGAGASGEGASGIWTLAPRGREWARVQVAHVANEGRSLEGILSIPAASRR